MNNDDLIVYTPNYKYDVGLFKTWSIMIKNIVRSRELIWQLFRRDFLMSYKKSFLGLTWIFISPIVGIISWVFLNYAGILKPGELGIPFPAYILLTSSIWGLFMGFYGSAAGTLSAGAGFIMQVKYPHEVLLVKQTAQNIANFLITFVVNIIVLLLFGVVPSWTIIFFPIVMLPLFFLGAGMGLIMSVVAVVAADINNIFNILLGLVFYITPIVYTQDTIKSDLLSKLIAINPLTYLIGAVRDITVFGRIDNFDKFLVFGILSFVFFMFSWRFFYISEDRVIEKML